MWIFITYCMQCTGIYEISSKCLRDRKAYPRAAPYLEFEVCGEFPMCEEGRRNIPIQFITIFLSMAHSCTLVSFHFLS